MTRRPSLYRRTSFPTTRWTLVARASDIDISIKRQALEELLSLYLPAIRTHLVVRKGIRPDDVDDLIQGFIASQVIERDLIARVNQEKGKFRSYLLTALRNYIINHALYKCAKSRTGGPMTDLDKVPEHASDDPTVDSLFDVEWARGVLSQALQQMRKQCMALGRQEMWQLFEYRLLRPILDGQPSPSYAMLVKRFNLKCSSQAANLLVTSKRMFARVLRSVVAQYTPDTDEIEHEIDDLMQALSQGGSSPQSHDFGLTGIKPLED